MKAEFRKNIRTIGGFNASSFLLTVHLLQKFHKLYFSYASLFDLISFNEIGSQVFPSSENSRDSVALVPFPSSWDRFPWKIMEFYSSVASTIRSSVTKSK